MSQNNIKKRLGGHKSPMERFFDLACQISVASGEKTFTEVDVIKQQEYCIRDKREQNHGTSIRKMGSDAFKDSNSFKMWGQKLCPEGVDNLTGRELLKRMFDAAIDNPISYNSSYKGKPKADDVDSSEEED